MSTFAEGVPMTPGGGADHDVVEIRVPASSAYVSTVRLAAAGLGALCGMTVDDIDDLRLVADEACSLLLQVARGEAPLEVRFAMSPGCLEIVADVASTVGAEVDRSGFGWTVLQALTSSIEAGTADGRTFVGLTIRHAVARP